MKILIYISSLHGGGAERVATMWANGFINNGNDVCLLVNKRGEKQYGISSGIEIIEVGEPYGGRLYRKYRQLKRIREAVRRFLPDVIITLLHPLGLYVYLATVGFKIPIINTEHNAFDRTGKAKWSKFELFNKYYVNGLFQHITVLAQADKDIIGKRFRNVTVLPNPLAFEPVSEVPAKEKIVLAMGRLDAWYIKGFDVLIRAWKMVFQKHPDWRLRIVGDGNDDAKQILKEMCEENGVSESVEFPGFYEDPTVVYRPAAIFVLSSRCEGFGMVVVEAMSQGCACVACDYGGRQSGIIRSDEEGLICQIENEKQMSNEINKLIEDDQFRMAIQKKSIERSRDFSLPIIMDKWYEIIQSCYENHKKNN